MLDTAITLKLHSGLPNLINLMPIALPHWETLYEILFQKALFFDRLRVMGCFCYAPLLPKDVDMFSPMGRKCVLVRCPPHEKGYKLFDLDNHEIFVARDVIFHEDIFSFKQSFSFGIFS